MKTKKKTISRFERQGRAQRRLARIASFERLLSDEDLEEFVLGLIPEGNDRTFGELFQRWLLGPIPCDYFPRLAAAATRLVEKKKLSFTLEGEQGFKLPIPRRVSE